MELKKPFTYHPLLFFRFSYKMSQTFQLNLDIENLARDAIKTIAFYRKIKTENKREYAESKRIQTLNVSTYWEFFMTNLEKTPECKPVNLKEWNANFQKNINMAILAQTANNYYFDPTIYKILTCVANINVLIYNPYPRENKNLNIKKFFGPVKKLSEGEFGEVYVPKSETNTNFIIKFNRYGKDELKRELFISFVLNTVRTRVPNFMMGFGFFDCANPIAIEKEGQLGLCDVAGKRGYAIFERINGETFTDFLVDEAQTLEDILNPFLQILFALYSVRQFKFTHNDLHTGNVMLRRTSTKNFYIPYRWAGKIIYLKSDYVATIIDYGYAYVRYKNNHYGAYNAEERGIYNKRPNYIRDPYKFFMFTVFILFYKKKDALANKLEPLFRFFNKEDHYRAFVLSQRRTIYDVYSNGKASLNYNHTHLINYILKTFPQTVNKFFFIKEPKGKLVIGCDHRGKGSKGSIGNIRCLNYDDYLENFNAYEQNIISFLDSIRNDDLDFEKTISYFKDHNIVFTDALDRADDILDYIDDILDPFLDILDGFEDNPMIEFVFFEEIKNVVVFFKFVGSLVSMLNKYNESMIYRDSLIYYYAVYGSMLKIKKKDLDDLEVRFFDLSDNLTKIREKLDYLFFSNKIRFQNLARGRNGVPSSQKKEMKRMTRTAARYKRKFNILMKSSKFLVPLGIGYSTHLKGLTLDKLKGYVSGVIKPPKFVKVIVDD